MLTINSIEQLRGLVGQRIGTTDWHRIGQETIDEFGAVTEDTERIHLDIAAARNQGLDSTIAHGLYVLSLGPKFFYELMEVRGYSRVLNYGYEKVRFLAPIPVDSSVRMTASIANHRPIDGGTIIRIDQTFDLLLPDGELSPKPACHAEAAVAYFD